MYMIWMVLDQVELLDKIQQAWEKAGIYGATFVESSGFFRQKQGAKYIATRYVLPSMSPTAKKYNYTVFSIVESEEQIQTALRATEEITGDLNSPNRGVFAAWPLLMVKGLSTTSNDEEQQ